ncbi:CRTAC1 family protein [Pelagicoccus sp. NFK12]|uniref:CRTAC1 family protein n=1 Tax=Pelagicoccus enzymogenes TaxID=2773457 RepID=A0A927FC89_9BACT|nr:CRTAC1 family protein [Pelagicoccus enzymogenes]MBD5782468.1 CRTAC1 family protein [Pelagicoccus enzymogenes]
MIRSLLSYAPVLPSASKRLVVGWVLCGLFGWASNLSAQFVDATLESGIFHEQMVAIEEEQIIHFQSGGAAAGDFDGDGWVDLFVTRVGAPDILYRNLGRSGPQGVVTFQDITSRAGVGGSYHSNGAAWADIDNDGDLDLYVTTLYHNRFYLYLNNGDGTFSEEGTARGADLASGIEHHGFSVSFGDYDRDGYLDFHVSEWEVPQTGPDAAQHNALMRNLGAPAPGYFSNQTLAAGVGLNGLERPSTPGVRNDFAFTSRFNDMDNDGWPDLLVAADYRTSQLFWNRGDGTFVDEGAATGVGLDGNGMGADVGDFDGDGLLDWFVTSISDNRLYRNLGERRFEDVSLSVGPGPGVSGAGWGWGTAFLDGDNDGDLDLVMTNGHQDLDNPSRILESIDQTTYWRNDDGVYQRFSDAMGFTDRDPGKGLLVFDYDNDGDLDVFIANCQTKPILYRNDTVTDNRWLRVNLVGRKSNSHGIGARLELQAEPDGPVQLREVSASSHFLAQSEVTSHFGLGDFTGNAHQLTVRWPSGVVQTLSNLPVDREIRILEPVTYQEWETRLSPRTLPYLGGRDADFDSDGFSNFMEYLFATDPRDAGDLPELEWIDPRLDWVDGAYRISYQRPLGAADRRFVCELSSDLDVWKEFVGTPQTVQAIDSPDGRYQWVEANLPAAQGTSWFLRVRAVETVIDSE